MGRIRNDDDERPPATGVTGRERPVLMAGCAVVLAAVAVKCVVVILPQLYWDTDPRTQADWVQTTMGPGGLAWLNVASVLMSAIVIAAHVVLGGRLHWIASLFVVSGMLACAVHMPGHAENMRLGGSWIAAAALGLAALHLAGHDGPRRLMVATFIALLVPMALQAVWYVWVEHPEFVERYTIERQANPGARGMATGTSGQLLFERRLRAPDAFGSFSMSNVFGSVVGALTLLSMSMVLGVWAARRHRAALLPLGIAAAGVVAVGLSRSKGASIALLGVVVLLGAFRLVRRRAAFSVPLGSLCVLVVAAGVAAVLVRGAWGPPDPGRTGDRSLLFRFHYWQAAAAMLEHRPPGDLLTGTGPARFKDLYPRLKNALNPEEVSSAHNVLIDYVTMLGLGGIAWCGVLLAWLYASARRATDALAGVPPAEVVSEPVRPASIAAPDLGWALLVAVLVFGTQYAFEHPEMDARSVLVWILGVGGFVFVATVLQGRPWSATPWTSVGLCAAALFLLFHGQIEITFFMAGSSAIAWVLVAASAGRKSERSPWRLPRMLVPVALLAAAATLTITAALPVTRQQRDLSRAAVYLRAGNTGSAIVALEDAVRAVPVDPQPYQAAARLMLEAGRRSCVDRLLDASLRAGLDESWRLRLRVDLAIYDAMNGGTGPPPAWADEAVRELLVRQPHSIQDHLRAADLRWRLGQRNEANAIYRRSLELSRLMYLDPVRQLTGRQRRYVEERIAQSSR